MKIAIVDDSLYWRKKIRSRIAECLGEGTAELMEFQSGEQLLQNPDSFDAVFLDVEMSGRDGFDTALAYGDLYPESTILILTLHAELSRKGYLVNAFRYIDKQYMNEEIAEALEAMGFPENSDQVLQVKVYNEGICSIPESGICCIETVPHGVLIHTQDRDYRAAAAISEIIRTLNPELFFRTHNSWIVHWKYVDHIENMDVIMKNGMKAMISRKQIQEARKKFWEYKFHTAKG